MITLLATFLLAVPVASWTDQQATGESRAHPMDPLTAAEYALVVEALKKGGYVGEAGLYPLITLREPAKAEVTRWRPGDPLARRAFVILKKGRETFEAEVDIGREVVTSWEAINDVEPNFLLSEEWAGVQRLVYASREWRSAVAERGIGDLRDVVCIPNTVGYYGIAEEAGRRLVKVVCYSSAGIGNFWGRPIEGLIAVVDLHSHEVRLIDTGPVPLPGAPVDFDEASVGALREAPHPIDLIQSDGPSFRVNGNVVSWQKWRFHFRIDPRLGLVISTVGYSDGREVRSILYQGSLSELFVPYMDPDVGWFFRTYLDAGEFGVGKLAVALEPDYDCPPNATFFAATFADDWGEPYTQPRAACLFERYSGDIAWRHSEAVTGRTEVRRKTELVLRSISTIGNYDYIFDWVFRQDGTIRIAVGATGVEQVKAVKSATVLDDKHGRDTAYGRMVANHTVAVNHDHFFSFRVDLDVDGPRNSFLYETLRTEQTDQRSPRGSVWVVDSQILATESTAKLRIDFEKPALWRVVNPNVMGPTGYPVAYQLKPQWNAVSLLDPDDMLRRRTAFTDYHLWVTAYSPRERYAAGTYPNQSQGGAGLPSWTHADRAIENTDLVLWYTLGFHHVVRTEDWPVLPTNWSGFELRPFDFFTRNPALDLPK